MTDSRVLLAAQGYLELGMYEDAWNELENLEPDRRVEVPVLLMRLQVFIGLKKWDSAAVLSESLMEKGCHLPDVYIQGAYGIRRSRSLLEAKAFLLEGEQQNPECATIHFNLACYAAQLGDLGEAKKRLEI